MREREAMEGAERERERDYGRDAVTGTIQTDVMQTRKVF